MNAPVHHSPYDEALGVAVEAARAGAAIIRDHAGSQRNVRAKGTNDFVTATDEAAQAAILEVIQTAFPNDAILAEERPAGHDLPPAVSEKEVRRWIIDPIDGTMNFMQQVPPYAVSIARQDPTGLQLGVVLDVPHDELFTAVRGHGLRVNDEGASVSHTSALADAFVATGFPYRRLGHTNRYLEVLSDFLRSARGARRHGSAAIDLARVACGRFDGFFETGLAPWDVAAGILCVREAGGRVTTYRAQGGLAPVYRQQVCATNSRLHAAFLSRLHRMRDITD
ncbi:inositol monophosphatase family protein [Salisaeta longa]|uniref:inositol monophosphatase family protein n=1 Tax=Salisaeta longa TaxID=503170 RepID=UPI0003B53119|nr:inositol monophosphatase family protein [Salisaeta longa]